MDQQKLDRAIGRRLKTLRTQAGMTDKRFERESAKKEGGWDEPNRPLLSIVASD